MRVQIRPSLLSEATTLLVGVTITGVLLWNQKINNQISADQLAAQATLTDISNTKVQQLASQNAKISADLVDKQAQLAKAEADLSQKTKDLATKQAELDKINAQLADDQKKIDSQQSQLSANATELKALQSRPPLFNFSNKSSQLANVSEKEDEVKKVVTAAYDTISDIYGAPYLLHSITITFVDQFQNPSASGETVITNSSSGLSIDIHLKDFSDTDFNDVNTIIHEIIHAFHGLSGLNPAAYEEGETVAATDAVMTKLIAAGKIQNFSPLYIRINDHTYLTSDTSVYNDRTEFYDSSSVADEYQLIGYGWYQLYKADPNFFKDFNSKIYTQKRNGNDITQDMVLTAIRQSYSDTVDGMSVDSWLKTKAFVLN